MCLYKNDTFILINLKFSFSGDTLSISYLIYKSTVALALLVIEIVILIFYPEEKKSKFFIYPQHWGFALITLAFILDASLVISRYIVQKNKKPGTKVLY